MVRNGDSPPTIEELSDLELKNYLNWEVNKENGTKRGNVAIYNKIKTTHFFSSKTI